MFTFVIPVICIIPACNISTKRLKNVCALQVVLTNSVQVVARGPKYKVLRRACDAPVVRKSKVLPLYFLPFILRAPV